MKRLRGWLCIAIAMTASCSSASGPARVEKAVIAASAEDVPLAGGATTVQDTTRDAFGLPAASLSPSSRTHFFVGNSFFNQTWVSAPATVATRDGLGPLFNARSCSTCHLKDGRGKPPDPGSPLHTMLLRISIAGRGEHGEPLADPIYGDQIQNDALPGVAREADVIATYAEQPGTFADGEAYAMRVPTYTLRALGYGDTAAELMLSPRVAPHLVGLGLLEAVPESAIDALADAIDANRDGISGHKNRVWDYSAARVAFGRFGWKAEQPSVRQQVAGAFLGDMGLTSSIFTQENCSASEHACTELPSGGTPEVSDATLDDVVRYSRTLGVPARRDVSAPNIKRGEALFADARCTACHVETLHTGAVADIPELADQTIHPYTDLLLHDMGEPLSDQRPAFEAEAREWRTPPLWGIGLIQKVNEHTFFLHDGRARNLQEALLWHGGEAEASKQRFMHMSKSERADLIAFLGSL